MVGFEFGDILKGKRTKHPIIFFSTFSNHQFYGCIITHAGNYKNNFALLREHFIENNENGEPFQIQFENSYCAKLKLEKENKWGPYQKVGSLSIVGKDFVRGQVQNEQPISWNKYMRCVTRKKIRIKPAHNPGQERKKG